MDKLKRVLSLTSLLLVLSNSVLPYYFSANVVFAQEVSATPTLAPEVSEPTPTPSETSAPDEPTASVTTPTPTPVLVEPETTPTVTPTPSVIPAITPSPVEPVITSTPTPVPVPTPSIWKNIDSNTTETLDNVEVGREYIAPQNNKVKINFTKLPDTSGKLTTKEVKLSPDQVKQLKAASDTAYDITSTMLDGTFAYDLTLPLPEQAKGKQVEIKSAENTEELSKATNVNEPKEEKADTVTIKGLNHFTIFVVTEPAVIVKAVSSTIDANNGYPQSYTDNNGTVLMPCLDGADPKCVLPGAGEEPNFNPDLPAELSGNFPSEFFYYIAESDIIGTPGGGKFMMRFALEGAFINDDPAPGEQITFGRIRATGTNLQPNSTYTVTHPYGEDTYQTDGSGGIARQSGTDDIGCEATPCDFAQALDSRVFNSFLRFDSGAPAGNIGDAVSAKTVTGSPTGNNFVKITGPGLPEGGLTTDKFSVAGKLFAAAPPPPAAPDPTCVNTASEKPTLKTPANNSIDNILNPTLSWNPVSSFGINCQGNTNKFEVFFSEGLDPTTSLGEADANLKDKIVSSLKTSTIYSWKVRAKNGALFTDSDVWTFTTAAVKPTLRAVSGSLGLDSFPNWYSDDNGLKVSACLDGTDPICVLPGAGEEPNWNPEQLTELGINFPSEFFYWIAESDFMTTPQGGKVSVRVALEGAFLNEEPFDGDQMVFGRIRVTGTRFEPNSTYVVTHPFGMDIYQSDELGILRRGAATEDIGCFGAPCDFKAALDSRVFGAFLRWDSGAPVGYLGDAVTAHTITGSPTGNNFFKIKGPGLPEGGLTTDLFTVSGKIAPDQNPQPVAGCTDSSPDKPILVGPTDKAIGISRNPTLSWEGVTNFGTNCLGNADQVEVFLSEGNVNPTSSQGSFTKSATSLNVLNLKADTAYSWKVTAKNGALSANSDIRTFTTTASSAKSVSTAVNAANGYPGWYSDNNGLKLVPCLDGQDPNCVLPGAGEEPNFNPDLPAKLPDNFPSEFFYLLVESDPINIAGGGKFNMRFAVEGAFATEDPQLAKQIVFGRIRATGNDLQQNSTYIVTHPYGVDTYETDATGTLNRTSATEDIGCGGNPCDFAQALQSRVFDGFLRWDNGAPAGYLGDAGIAHKVTGSPNGTNFVKIEGPGLPDGGLSTNLFNVSGKLFVESPVVPNPNPSIDTDSPVIVNPPVVNPPTPDDQKGSITIIEKSLPQDVQDFEFSRSSGGGDFTLDDDTDPTLANQIIMSDLSTKVYSFSQLNVPLGWILKEITCSDPNNNSIVDLNTASVNLQLDKGEVITCTFTNIKKGSIAGNLFEDKNGNAVKEAGDLAISQRTVFLDNNDNGVLDSGETSMATDTSGNYQFSALMPGNYNIREVIPQSWFQTLPTSGKLAVDLIPGAGLTGQDFGSTVYYSIGSGGKFTPIGLTDSVRSLGESIISVLGNGGVSVVSIPDGTIISRVDNSLFDTAQLSAALPLLTFISGIDTAKFAPVSVLQWGIPNIGLAFSKPITINLFVGQSFNGQTLNIFRSATGSTGWTTEGLAAPQSCTVLLGICTIQTTLASFFVAAQTVPQAPASNNTNSSSTSNSSNSSASVCADSKPGSAPILLSAVTSGSNQVTLTWSKALDPVSNYSIVYGLTAGNPIYGNPNVGGKETTSYVVSSLSGNTTYYFKVKAINGCNGSEYSNELSAAPGGATIQKIAQGFTEGVLGTQTNQEKPLSKAVPSGNQATRTVPLILAALGVLAIVYFKFFHQPKPKQKNTDPSNV